MSKRTVTTTISPLPPSWLTTLKQGDRALIKHKSTAYMWVEIVGVTDDAILAMFPSDVQDQYRGKLWRFDKVGGWEIVEENDDSITYLVEATDAIIHEMKHAELCALMQRAKWHLCSLQMLSQIAAMLPEEAKR